MTIIKRFAAAGSAVAVAAAMAAVMAVPAFAAPQEEDIVTLGATATLDADCAFAVDGARTANNTDDGGVSDLTEANQITSFEFPENSYGGAATVESDEMYLNILCDADYTLDVEATDFAQQGGVGAADSKAAETFSVNDPSNGGALVNFTDAGAIGGVNLGSYESGVTQTPIVFGSDDTVDTAGVYTGTFTVTLTSL